MVNIAENPVDLINFFDLPEVIDLIGAEKISQKFIVNLDNTWKCDYSRNGYVYVINAIGTNRYKIGKTNNLERRLSELNSKQSPHELKIIFEKFCSDNAAFEATLHSLCSNFRVHNEWFEFDKTFFSSIFNHPQVGSKMSKQTQFECIDDLKREGFLMLYFLCQRVLARNTLNNLVSNMQKAMQIYYGQKLPSAILCAIDNTFYLLFNLLNFTNILSEENSLLLGKLAEELLDRYNSFLLEEVYYNTQCVGDKGMRDILLNENDFLLHIVDTSMRLQEMIEQMERTEEFTVFRSTHQRLRSI